MLALKKELKMLDSTCDLLGSYIAPESNKPVYIILYAKEVDVWRPVVKTVYNRPQASFGFLYFHSEVQVFIFQDNDENMRFDPQRDSFATSTLIYLDEVIQIEPLTLRYENFLIEDFDLSQLNLFLASDAFEEIVNLEEPSFNQESGILGYWQPLEFIKSIGGGLFFLEPFDENKIPIIFVHGALGYPQEWTAIINGLDRTKYQPWIFQYPSGLRLDYLSEFLRRSVALKYAKYKFPKVILVAHSMGGLLCKNLLDSLQGVDVDFVPLLVTISTPWSGHTGAASGVDNSPIVVPSWVDMDPRSSFIENLFLRGMPEKTKFSMLFSFKGSTSLVDSENNDGSISLVSELRQEAQAEADTIRGFDETHTGILRSVEVSKYLNFLFDVGDKVQK
jgi:pimeloyl-ACP methyl ester carboxylesterase